MGTMNHCYAVQLRYVEGGAVAGYMLSGFDAALNAAKSLPLGEAKGPRALRDLAERFPQLYVEPVSLSGDCAEGESGDEQAAKVAAVDEAYRAAARKGIAPTGASLAHFAASPEDELRLVQTPAGPVQVLFLKHRAAFETFLQCIGHKAHAVPISPSVGAITYRGINDWSAVRAARYAYVKAGGESWALDMPALAKNGAFKAELIVISSGPYSNIPASATPYDEGQWLDISREIRLHHECAHVVCRRMMPDDVNPLWDEITADAVGLIKAIGRYDAALAAMFLGVSPEGYVGGRLEEYLDESQRADIDGCARRVHAAIASLGEHAQRLSGSDPFDFLLEMKRNPLI